ncbi:MAG: RtcB family protein [Limisphaerales bacterium]
MAKIYPHLIGGDIGCGMALFKTDLVRRDAKLDRWAEKYFHLEHPWDEEVGEFLAEQYLESTEFDKALGTIVGGNHFAELQMVEKVLDAGAFKQLGLGKQQLVVLVHSGSRGLGETICAHTLMSTSAMVLKRSHSLRRNISVVTITPCAGPRRIANSSHVASLRQSVPKRNPSGTAATTISRVANAMGKWCGCTAKVRLTRKATSLSSPVHAVR